MPKFKIEIREILSKIIEIEASTEEEAQEIVVDKYERACINRYDNFILTFNDHAKTEMRMEPDNKSEYIEQEPFKVIL